MGSFSIGQGGAWRTARKMWVYKTADRAWHPVRRQYAGKSGAWQLGYSDDVPAALHSIVVTPSTASIAMGSTQVFTAQGYDAAMNPIPCSVTWSLTTLTDTIDADGTFHAGGSPDSGTVSATAGTVSGTASYTVS